MLKMWNRKGFFLLVLSMPESLEFFVKSCDAWIFLSCDVHTGTMRIGVHRESFLWDGCTSNATSFPEAVRNKISRCLQSHLSTAEECWNSLLSHSLFQQNSVISHASSKPEENTSWTMKPWRQWKELVCWSWGISLFGAGATQIRTFVWLQLHLIPHQQSCDQEQGFKDPFWVFKHKRNESDKQCWFVSHIVAVDGDNSRSCGEMFGSCFFPGGVSLWMFLLFNFWENFVTFSDKLGTNRSRNDARVSIIRNVFPIPEEEFFFKNFPSRLISQTPPPPNCVYRSLQSTNQSLVPFTVGTFFRETNTRSCHKGISRDYTKITKRCTSLIKSGTSYDIPIVTNPLRTVLMQGRNVQWKCPESLVRWIHVDNSE